MFSTAVCVVALATVFSGVQGNPLTSWFPWPSGGSSDDNLNWVVDDILQSVSADLIKQGGDQMQLKGSSFDYKSKVEILFWDVEASAVSTAEGTLKNLSSVIRSSDAGIFQEVEEGSLKNITMKAELSLKDMEMIYDSVDVNVWIFSYSGGLKVKCPGNTFDVAINFRKGDSCPAKVESASIKALSSCSIELAKGGVVNWFKKYILSYAFGKVVDTIKTAENEALPEILTLIVQQHNICKFLNPSQVS